ncbi:kelch-like protein 40b [Drosophila kikkawai]|uniref:Kelch-like protein 40b n=1 Tax=Drosophila kikkawai TaxID=30033 RepID=A0A6P4IEW6_DROKI|nr:kelch-like protein 40b [Drosophila kikkawai]XP_017021079.1 kelch-like protein 40b [Drosophila kikkawai]
MDVWLQPVFANLIENKKFSDCRILVENEAFDCHKVILASCSEFFERLFLGSFQEAKSDEIRLQEIKAKTFAMFIQYVYTYSKEKLNECSNSMIMDLLTCGTRWLVDSIVSECVKILKGRVNDMMLDDLLDLFQNAHSINHQELIEISVKFLRSRFSTAMNCYDVLTMTSDVFEQYTIITGGYLPEIERFKMIEAYVTVNGLIDSDPAKTSEVEVHRKKEGDSGIGELVAAKTSSDDDEQESSENEESEDKEEDEAKERGTVERNNTKIKVLHSKYVEMLLSHIKFNKMMKSEFYHIVGKSPLLTFKEKYENMYLTQPDKLE